ncbi:hypothetical protein BTH42_08590 [Burkholderia sp. SRS-W-2-2016]|uniref:porin n=1 Tax=Burkholderia sp. SRS-W-2-2016 TaxID=1926878 RepID=UPI00094B1D2C|nr:porin [Burkholderia sp. SRS-W-2-2016]OLL32476.1 hypothetical protein BTH42_08590 [Burkholderia sp. SRS-W-2-2016]
MKMQYWVAAGCCALSVSAYAKTSITLFGIIDNGIEYVSNANPAGEKLVRMPAITGELPSRWGVRGSEDLGGNLQAVFTLESGFNARDGELGLANRLFGRQAWVGLASPYGQLSFGRQYTMTSWANKDSDILGPDIFGSGALDPAYANARSDNAIAYKGKFNGLTLGATYSFGRESSAYGTTPRQGPCAGQVAGARTQCRQWSALLKYDASSFGVAAAYDEQRGGGNAAANFFDGIAPVPLTNAADKDIRMQLNGWAKLRGLKVGGGWAGRRVRPDSPAIANVYADLFYLGASYPVTSSFIVDGEVFRVVNARHNTRATMGTLRSTYLLSARTAVYLQGAYLANSAQAAYTLSTGGGGTTPAKGASQLGMAAGIRHSF